MVGKWEINVTVGKLPERIATGLSGLSIIGAEYEPIAYLGSQVVNGTNHAVLAEQVLTTGRDVRNIVLMIFNERDDAVTLSNIERVIESGGELGGFNVDVKTEIPKEAMEAFDKAVDGLIGFKMNPFALLGTQAAGYAFAAEMIPATENPEKSAVLVEIDTLTKKVHITDIIEGRGRADGLGYAFTWLTRK